MLLVGAASLIEGLAIVAQAFGLTKALVEVWQLHAVATLPMPIAIFVVAFAVRQLCGVFKQRIGTRYADTVVADLRPRLQHKLFTGGPALVANRGTGATVTMLIDGLDQVTTYIQTLLPKMMDMMFIPVIALVAVWWNSWLSGLVLLLALPLLLFFMAILGMAARDKSDKQYGEFRKLNNRFTDAIQGLPTLKMLGVSDAYEKEIYSVSERFRNRTMSVIRVAMTSSFALDFFTTLSIAVVAVFLGTNLINGAITLFPALFALILAPEYFLPVRQFGNDYHATLNGKNAMSDIMALLDAPEPERDDTLAWTGWGQDSGLHMQSVGFRYAAPDKRPDAESDASQDSAGHAVDESNALQDISLDFRGYQTVAVVGSSGAGKSTLINLLAGFRIPQRGSITLDGRTLHHLNVASWQRHISYIPQDPYIFHGSICENISFYNPKASREAVASAAEQAGLRDWLATLPQGLDTQIGEGNRGVSGGQAQRIALARVVLDSSREILLFDEPTAHLDIETEYDLKQTLLPVMRNHLVILATHRLHWLANVDQVVVLEQGGIAETGAPSELIGGGGALDALMSQMGGNRIER